jgi:hypothetical protein
MPVSNSIGAASISNWRAATEVSNSSTVMEVSTLDLKYPTPCTWLDTTLFYCAKDDEGNNGEATTVAEDVIQGNKSQEAIDRAGSYDAG